ncbi:hypothetical protein [Marilutibacter aestuarii]|uniref:Uncharacterized protein n=1 Tax=Marilutibacter aestuarii TaxID=1706195 RepID=A0A508AQX1_9GAMM|nr:hypothetical protein [Lysobacter aestuarii]TQD50891.1 hypothetical protein FKV25_03090 [Lysobacter aestuarii]
MPASPRFRHAPDERAWIALGVLLLHAWAVSWLLSARQPLPIPGALGEDVTQVHFIRPAPAPVAPAPATPVPAPDDAPRPSGSEPLFAPTPSTPAPGESGLKVVELPRTPPSTLRLPDDYVPIDFRANHGVNRQGPILDARTTRFADDWATDGDLVEKLKEDHVAVRIALGLFGGRDTCTREAIRQRRADCVGADFQPELHEAVQGY